MKHCLALLLLAALLTGCASLPRGPGCVKIGPFGGACLLPPAALPAVRASHIVNIVHEEQKDTFLGQLRVDHQTMRLAASSLFGTHLFTIDWDGHRVSVQPPREGLRPKLITAMLEAAIADPARLRPQLHGIELAVSKHADGSEVRELREHGRLVARIQRSSGGLDQAYLSIDIAPAKLHLELKPMEAQ